MRAKIFVILEIGTAAIAFSNCLLSKYEPKTNIQKMRRLSLLMMMLMLTIFSASAQRTTDKLDRGLVAVPSGSGSFVSWRIFGEEYYDTQYNLYRDGVRVNPSPLSVSNIVDPNGHAGSKYQVAAVVRGVEQEKSAEVLRQSTQFIEFKVKPILSRRGTDISNDYSINDIALADVDGDGVSEFLVKRNYNLDSDATGPCPVANDSAFNFLECYNIKGDRLWYIDLGPNMCSGPDEQYDIVGYDWDGDGKAEVLMRGADNMIIYHNDGSQTNIGNMNVNTRNTVLHTANMTYTNTGAEYLLYMEGATGKPYSIGPSGAKWLAYPLPRGDVNDWGDGYGHRATKHYFAAPFLDGRHPYIFLGRGCYTKHHMKAFSVNPETHLLNLYWEWKSPSSGAYFGQGFHNFGIADVDWDGRDEIVFGSMVIDDNGKGLSTTGLGHGDAQHCSDFDPYRHGQEIFTCNEDHPAMNYRDATTSKIYYRLQSTSDDGRALCGNFSNDYPGCIGHSSQSGTVSTVADKVISGAPSGFTNNFRIYWDGDLLEEGLDGASSREGASRVVKADGSVVFTANGTANCNWTKNTPSATGDILGDWREEIIVRTSDNKGIRVYTTDISTPWRNYTLWHDHQYRQGMVWESVGYNQPPHASYFLGELEEITVAPPPLTMTGRTEVNNGGTIGSALDDKHVIVCETGDTHITVTEGAKPWIATFNIPSWVQGTNSSSTNGKPTINYTYYTCTVDGGAFGGATRLVKQGDGTLNLPKVEQQYSGNTDIWAGIVNFDGSMLHSSLWLNRFAELNSDGGKFRRIKMDYGSKLRPGRADNKGEITTDSLLLGFGSRVVFDIYEDLSSDCVKTRVLSVETKDWKYGPEYLMPVFEFVCHNGEEPATGRYLIGEASIINGNINDIKIEGISTRMSSCLTLEDGKIYLDISSMRDNTDIYWSGIENNVWENGGASNFTNATGESDSFVTGDKVIFNDNASQFTVSLNGDIEADSIIVENNTNPYIFNGTGSIVGNTTLVKRGNSTLTVMTDNTYTGGTRISGGAVAISSLSNANQAKGNLGSMTTLANKFVIENGAELRSTSAVTNGSAIQFDSEEGGVINNFADFVVARSMSGTKLTKKGSGWMKLNVANTNLERLVIAAGTVQCVSCSFPAQTVEFQNGTLSENASSAYTIDVPQGKKGTWNLVDRANYTNKLIGKGTLTVYCPVVIGSGWAATRTQISGNWSEFEGTINCQVHSSDTRFTLDNGYGMPKGIFNIPSNVELQNSGRTYRIGKVAGTGSLGGSCSFSNGATPGANTWQVGDDSNWSWSGKVTSNAHFVKVGSGKLTYSGNSDNTGNVTVSEGELQISSCVLGKGILTVSQNGTLSGTNKAEKPLTNSSVTVNGKVHPGNSASSYMGLLYFGNKNVTFSAGSVLELKARQCATNTNPGCTSISGINNLTMNGTLVVTVSENHTLKAGDSIRVWQANSMSGTPVLDLQPGIEWDTTRLSEGLLFVVSVSDGIEDIRYSITSPNNIYDLNGRLVRKDATSTEGLPSGIYIRRGKKIIVK